MSQCRCYIGIAFHNISLRTQWALVLSEDPDFTGLGCGSTAVDTVDGRVMISWEWFQESPAGFNPRGRFWGVIRVGQVPMSINNLKLLISSSNRASAEDRTYFAGTDDIPWGCDKYVVLALLRLYEDRRLGLTLPKLGRNSLFQFIQGRIRDLLRYRVSPAVYPVVSLSNGNVSFGHSN